MNGYRAPARHRGPSDRYARGIVHGVIVGVGLGLVLLGLLLLVWGG
ncbi:hypothetical protein BZB76_0552 [Actinomadura pelletieri DSM 43383]|uniref:Uncharacterized protein n=1 Tax=Actinomadura pelletieri DSM 43383 TaxID=1120940 RepID=A0A495QYA7_9ACTN|nr:hypothetical protein [Actinomadura pelletieri]RKS79110.1 hypothetical protein BZB76_0552 [Actinomadura pelletieri DSM 43383]